MDPSAPPGVSPGTTAPRTDDATSLVRTIGRYHLVAELGRGAMGVVYKGFDPIIGRTVALKTIAFTDNDAATHELRQRLYREAGAAGTLSHPNIVTIYDIVEEGGTSAVAMEFIEGRTLADLVEERAPIPLEEALKLFEQICSALDYAGGRGIVHRDIKPANIMLTPAGVAKIADFGIARMAASTMTQAGVIMGSPSYMSPEQIRGQKLDGRADLFSATVVLYELLTGARPFAGDDMASTMFRIIHEPPVPANQFNQRISPEINSVFTKALAKEVNDRFANGAELYGAFRAAAGGRAPTVTLKRPTGNDATVLTMPKPDNIVAPAPAPSKTPMLVGGGALALVAVGVMVWFATSGGTPSTQPGSTTAPTTQAPTPPVGTPTQAGATPPATQAPAQVPAGAPTAATPDVAPTAPGQPAAVTTAPPTAADTTPPTPVPTPAPVPAGPTASIQVQYEGNAYPVSILANGKSIGSINKAGMRLTLPAGAVKLRAVSDAAYFSRDLGSLTLRDGERRTIQAPRTAGASIMVVGNQYEGLEIRLDGRRVAGPYPAQLRTIALGQHRLDFRWTGGALAGRALTDTISLSDGQTFTIRANPTNEQIEVRKLR